MSNTAHLSSARRPEEPQALLSELKSEVPVEAAPLLQFIVRHAGLIVAALVLFLAALAGTAAYNWHADRAVLEARTALAAAVAAEGPDRVARLEKFAAAAPDSIRAAAWLAVADAAVTQQDFAAAARAYGHVAAADADGALGLAAALNEAQALMRSGEPAKAVPVLERVVNLIPEAHRPPARVLLAEAALQAGQTQLARQTFETLAASAQGGDAEYFRFRARSLRAPATEKSAP